MPAVFNDSLSAHAVDPDHPDKKLQWAVVSGSNEYSVDLNQHDEWSCTCQNYRFHGRKRRPIGCKHTDHCEATLQDELLPSSSAPATPAESR